MKIHRALLLATIAQAAIAIGSYGLMLLAERSGFAIFGNLERGLVFVDVPAYFEHANRAFAGLMPYRDDPIEYPILALPFIFAPRIVARTQAGFVIVFAIEMLAFSTVLNWVVAARIVRAEGAKRVPRRLAWLTGFFACVSPFVIGRYDMVPTFLAFASACAWFSARPTLGGWLAAVGALSKVFPGAVAIAGVVSDLSAGTRKQWRGGLTFAATMAIGVAIWLAIGGRGVLASLRYHSERGIEVGSLASGVLWILGRSSGETMRVIQDHSSLNLVTSLAAKVAESAILVQPAAMIVTVGMLWLRKGRDPLRGAGALVLAFILFGKVLSPQYLIWAMPFVVATGGSAGRWARPSFLVASVLTLILYPWGTGGLRGLEDWAFVALNLRNVALLATFLALVTRPSGEPLRS